MFGVQSHLYWLDRYKYKDKILRALQIIKFTKSKLHNFSLFGKPTLPISN